MKLQQNVRHFASRKALETPGLRRMAKRGLVKLHTRIFQGRADIDHREERRDHLEAFFNATMDTYLAALQAHYTEAEAREITHIQANLDFHAHGWTEMMEIPVDELDAHLDRYAEFFEAHDITYRNPLGSFAPDDGIPTAPTTPERLEDPDQPFAEGGYADDAYVETPNDIVKGDRNDIDSDDVDLDEAVGVEETN